MGIEEDTVTLLKDERVAREDEERREHLSDPYYQWVKDNVTSLEIDFIKTRPQEEQPFDDDTPDFLDEYNDEYEAYCKERYEEEDGK